MLTGWPLRRCGTTLPSGRRGTQPRPWRCWRKGAGGCWSASCRRGSCATGRRMPSTPILPRPWRGGLRLPRNPVMPWWARKPPTPCAHGVNWRIAGTAVSLGVPAATQSATRTRSRQADRRGGRGPDPALQVGNRETCAFLGVGGGGLEPDGDRAGGDVTADAQVVAGGHPQPVVGPGTHVGPAEDPAGPNRGGEQGGEPRGADGLALGDVVEDDRAGFLAEGGGDDLLQLLLVVAGPGDALLAVSRPVSADSRLLPDDGATRR